jgi:hypothetical protein
MRLRAWRRDRRTAELLAPGLGQAEREAAAVGGIGLAIDEAGADQAVDCPADRRSAAPNLGRDLVERARLGIHHRAQQIALQARRLGRRGIAAKLFNQPGKAPQAPKVTRFHIVDIIAG